MERRLGEERLIAPNDFTSTAVSRNIQKDLVPPSHFAGPHRVVQVQGTTPSTPWANSAPSGDVSAPGPWSAIGQAQQEMLELRKDNRRITLLHKDSLTGKIPLDPPPGFQTRYEGGSKQWSNLEMEWHLEAEKHKAEAESLKKQVAALKDALERHRDETRDRDSILKRQNHELEAVHEELFQAKMELSKTREELIHNSAQKEKLSSELERLRGQFTEENAKLRRDAERSKEEARECALKAEAEEGAKQQALRLSEQLTEIHKKQEVELHASHRAELATARKTNSELQERLESITSEMLQLKSSLVEITTERDELRDHLSQMGQAFEKQSATLHSLRNYIGQLAPENSEKERLNDTVERLNKEKAALQLTAELLTVRLNAANEILALQEEQMRKKSSTDPLVKNNSEGLQVLQLWREKVFKLCVQLRCKDIELREEKDNLLSEVRSMEQQLQQEQHQASVLQHSLDDRIAELDLERVAKETLKQDLSLSHKQNSELKSQNQRVEAELKALTEGVHRFSQAFESKVADVDAALIKLCTLTQRLTFAKGRVETIQGLIMRKVALQKFQQASKQTEQVADTITNLQTELSLVREERHKLTQELKRTPELINKTLADLKEQHEIKLKQQQQELEQSWLEVRRAVASREEAEQRRQQVQAQLEESRINLEELSSELLNQQERSKRVLQERVSEIETCCAEKLREMELQVNTAKREHTKAVMILRQFEREAVRKRDELTERGIQDKQLNVDKDKQLLLTAADVGGLMSDYTRTRTIAPQEKSPERTHPLGAKVQLPAHERLLSVLEELHSLSAAVVSTTEDSAEEEETDILTAREDLQAVHT